MTRPFDNTSINKVLQFNRTEGKLQKKLLTNQLGQCSVSFALISSKFFEVYYCPKLFTEKIWFWLASSTKVRSQLLINVTESHPTHRKNKDAQYQPVGVMYHVTHPHSHKSPVVRFGNDGPHYNGSLFSYSGSTNNRSQGQAISGKDLGED